MFYHIQAAVPATLPGSSLCIGAARHQGAPPRSSFGVKILSSFIKTAAIAAFMLIMLIPLEAAIVYS